MSVKNRLHGQMKITPSKKDVRPALIYQQIGQQNNCLQVVAVNFPKDVSWTMLAAIFFVLVAVIVAAIPLTIFLLS